MKTVISFSGHRQWTLGISPLLSLSPLSASGSYMYVRNYLSSFIYVLIIGVGKFLNKFFRTFKMSSKSIKSRIYPVFNSTKFQIDPQCHFITYNGKCREASGFARAGHILSLHVYNL